MSKKAKILTSAMLVMVITSLGATKLYNNIDENKVYLMNSNEYSNGYNKAGDFVGIVDSDEIPYNWKLSTNEAITSVPDNPPNEWVAEPDPTYTNLRGNYAVSFASNPDNPDEILMGVVVGSEDVNEWGTISQLAAKTPAGGGSIVDPEKFDLKKYTIPDFSYGKFAYTDKYNDSSITGKKKDYAYNLTSYKNRDEVDGSGTSSVTINDESTYDIYPTLMDSKDLYKYFRVTPEDFGLDESQALAIKYNIPKSIVEDEAKPAKKLKEIEFLVHKGGDDPYVDASNTGHEQTVNYKSETSLLGKGQYLDIYWNRSSYNNSNYYIRSFRANKIQFDIQEDAPLYVLPLSYEAYIEYVDPNEIKIISNKNQDPSIENTFYTFDKLVITLDNSEYLNYEVGAGNFQDIEALNQQIIIDSDTQTVTINGNDITSEINKEDYFEGSEVKKIDNFEIRVTDEAGSSPFAEYWNHDEINQDYKDKLIFWPLVYYNLKIETYYTPNLDGQNNGLGLEGVQQIATQEATHYLDFFAQEPTITNVENSEWYYTGNNIGTSISFDVDTQSVNESKTNLDFAPTDLKEIDLMEAEKADPTNPMTEENPDGNPIYGKYIYNPDDFNNSDGKSKSKISMDVDGLESGTPYNLVLVSQFSESIDGGSTQTSITELPAVTTPKESGDGSISIDDSSFKWNDPDSGVWTFNYSGDFTGTDEIKDNELPTKIQEINLYEDSVIVETYNFEDEINNGNLTYNEATGELNGSITMDAETGVSNKIKIEIITSENKFTSNEIDTEAPVAKPEIIASVTPGDTWLGIEGDDTNVKNTFTLEIDNTTEEEANLANGPLIATEITKIVVDIDGNPITFEGVELGEQINNNSGNGKATYDLGEIMIQNDKDFNVKVDVTYNELLDDSPLLDQTTTIYDGTMHSEKIGYDIETMKSSTLSMDENSFVEVGSDSNNQRNDINFEIHGTSNEQSEAGSYLHPATEITKARLIDNNDGSELDSIDIDANTIPDSTDGTYSGKFEGLEFEAGKNYDLSLELTYNSTETVVATEHLIFDTPLLNYEEFNEEDVSITDLKSGLSSLQINYNVSDVEHDVHHNQWTFAGVEVTNKNGIVDIIDPTFDEASGNGSLIIGGLDPFTNDDSTINGIESQLNNGEYKITFFTKESNSIEIDLYDFVKDKIDENGKPTGNIDNDLMPGTYEDPVVDIEILEDSITSKGDFDFKIKTEDPNGIFAENVINNTVKMYSINDDGSLGEEIAIDGLEEVETTQKDGSSLTTYKSSAHGLKAGEKYNLTITYFIEDELIGEKVSVSNDIRSAVEIPLPESNLSVGAIIGIIIGVIFGLLLILLILLLLFLLKFSWSAIFKEEKGTGATKETLFTTNKKFADNNEKLVGRKLFIGENEYKFKTSENEKGYIVIEISKFNEEKLVSKFKFKSEKEDDKDIKVNVLNKDLKKKKEKGTENTDEAKREKFSKLDKPELVKQSVAKGLEEPIAKKATKPELVEFLVTGKKPKLRATATIIG